MGADLVAGCRYDARQCRHRRPYRGINALLLALEAKSHGYPLNRWLTYRRASEFGGQVRKGEHGTSVVLWRLRKVTATSDVYPDRRRQTCTSSPTRLPSLAGATGRLGNASVMTPMRPKS